MRVIVEIIQKMNVQTGRPSGCFGLLGVEVENEQHAERVALEWQRMLDRQFPERAPHDFRISTIAPLSSSWPSDSLARFRPVYPEALSEESGT